MGDRLRILFVAPYEPSALAVRSRLLLGAIAQRHDVDVLALHRREAAPAVPTGTSGGTYTSSALERIRSVRRLANPAYPFQALAAASRGMSRAVDAAIRSRDYDLVHVEHIRALQYVPTGPRPPVVFDAVDCVSRLFSMAAPEQRATLRWLFRAEAGRLARLESQALDSVDRVLVASQRDADALRERNPRGRITVLTNPVDLERFTPGDARRSQTVVMTGKMSFHANAVAAAWFAKGVWPFVRAQHGDARLVIAGAQPPRSLRRLAAGDISVTGYVDDLAQTIRSAAVAVAPLRYAAGVQNKVLEAMACATPVVATPAAVGDLAVRHLRDIVIAERPDELAAYVRRLLSDHVLARDIGIAGRCYVEQHHSTSALVDRLEGEYRATLHRDVIPQERVGLLGSSRSERHPIVFG
jgi:glycosyltransferase involved in cell wall biosynthesis